MCRVLRSACKKELCSPPQCPIFHEYLLGRLRVCLAENQFVQRLLESIKLILLEALSLIKLAHLYIECYSEKYMNLLAFFLPLGWPTSSA